MPQQRVDTGIRKLITIGAGFRKNLKPARVQSLLEWTRDTAKNNSLMLRSGRAGNATLLPQNTKYTKKRKQRRGYGTKPGVMKGDLNTKVGDLSSAARILSSYRSETYGSDRTEENNMKAMFLIKGRKHKFGHKKKKTTVQVPRPFMSHREIIVKRAALRTAELALRAWGWT